ncbi:MAG: MoaD/ThiS family protein [Candidatus Sumerlaea chitinivorans]|nr:MoaD/ThiS family protein [Candidatus Sumerlaea chitinivorans]
MNVVVRYYQKVREITGRSHEEFVMDPPFVTLQDLVSRLVARYPELVHHKNSLLYARNEEYCEPTAQLADGDVVDLMPPFSGG